MTTGTYRIERTVNGGRQWCGTRSRSRDSGEYQVLRAGIRRLRVKGVSFALRLDRADDQRRAAGQHVRRDGNRRHNQL